MDTREHGCSQPGFLLADIVTRGVIPENLCDRKHKWVGRIKTHPGEVVIFVKAPRWWEGQR